MKVGIHTFELLCIHIKSLTLSYITVPASVLSPQWPHCIACSTLPTTPFSRGCDPSLTLSYFKRHPQSFPKTSCSKIPNTTAIKFNEQFLVHFYGLSGASHTSDLFFLLANLLLLCFSAAALLVFPPAPSADSLFLGVPLDSAVALV